MERTEYGAYYSSQRVWTDDRIWHRINQFIFPFHTMISVGKIINLRSFVPLDDHHAMLISHSGNPAGPMPPEMPCGEPTAFDEVGGYEPRTNDPRSYFVTKANKRNGLPPRPRGGEEPDALRHPVRAQPSRTGP